MNHSMAVLTGPAGNRLMLQTRGPDTTTNHHILRGVDGWFGGVGVVGENTQRATSHGLFPEPNRRTGRAITLKGTLVLKDWDTRPAVERALSGILWDGAFGDLAVDDGDLALTGRVKLDGDIDVERAGLNGVRVSIPLLAPDPFLYGPRVQTPLYPPGYGEGVRWAGGPFKAGVLRYHAGPPPGGVLTNAGNATAWPVFTVRGSWPGGFRLSAGGQQVVFPRAVYEQAPVTVDMHTGSITVAGVDHTHLATRRQWFSIPAGQPVTVRVDQYAPSEGWVDCYTRDTYI